MNKLALALGLVALAGCQNLQRSRDLANPAVPAQVTAVQVCGLCHGATGNPVSPQFPRLAGQHKDYLLAQLKNFRSQNRSDPAGYQYMWGITQHLTDQQIDGLADYFSKQKPVTSGLTNLSVNQVTLGADIYQHGLPTREVPPCEACHGPQAEGTGVFPRLAGQSADYLEKQMHVFKETEYRPDTPMKQVTHNLTNDQIVLMAQYLQNFPRQ